MGGVCDYQIQSPRICRTLPRRHSSSPGKDVSRIPVRHHSLFRNDLPFFNFKFPPKDRGKQPLQCPQEDEGLEIRCHCVPQKPHEQAEHSAHPAPLAPTVLTRLQGLGRAHCVHSHGQASHLPRGQDPQTPEATHTQSGTMTCSCSPSMLCLLLAYNFSLQLSQD